MSNTVITNYTDLNGPSTKADSSVVVIVNKDGSLSVDQNLLGTLMGTDGSQSAGISVVRVGHEGKPDDATDSENEDDKVPHVTLTVDSYYDEPNSIIKYDSGAEILQSLRMETRENSLVGFHNDHCYTPLTSPSQVPQKTESFAAYNDPVIQISHTAPPKPVPSSKKITILEQQIIPKGKKIQLHSSDSPIIIKGNDALNKPFPVLNKSFNKEVKEADKLQSLKKSDESGESSSISSSGDSIPDRDSDSDYKERNEGSTSKLKKNKPKPRILKSTQAKTLTLKAESKTTPKPKQVKTVVRKEVKETKSLVKPVTKDEDIDLESLLPTTKIPVSGAPTIEFNKTVVKPSPKIVKKEKKTPAHVTALLSDMTSLFSTPDVIRRVSTDNKIPGKPEKETPIDKKHPTKSHESPEDKVIESQKLLDSAKMHTKHNVTKKENKILTPTDKTKNYDMIPQIDDASLAQILQDTSSISHNTVKHQPSITTSTTMSSPGLAGPLSPTLDLLGGLQPEEEGLTEDLLMHVAQLVESSENLQEVIDKQVLGKVDTGPAKTPVQSPFQQAGNLYTQTLSKSVQKNLPPKKEPIEIVRRDGRVITLPPIEAPATRSSKRKTMAETPNTAELMSPIPSTSLQTSESTPESIAHPISRQYINKKLITKKQEPVVQSPVADKISAESQESWNSEDDPNRLWCICKQPHNNRFMICCDGCEDWFHGKCVNITKAMGQQMEEQGIEWRCPNCIKKTKAGTSKTISKSLSTPKRNESLDSSLDTPKSPSVKESVSKTSCIVCKKSARQSSIYCSNNCILKHAQDSLEQGPSKSESENDKPHDKQKPELPSDYTVTVFERKSGKVLIGPNAPTAGNLKAWLQKNPTFEVVRLGSLNTTKPGLVKKKASNESNKVQTVLNFERIPRKSAEQGSKPRVIEGKEKKAAPPHKEDVKTPVPKTPASSRSHQIQVIDTPKASTSATKSEPRKLSRQSSRTQSSDKPLAASPTTSRRKDSNVGLDKNKMNSPEPIRDNVRKSLQEQLSLRMSETKDHSFTEDEIHQFAADTELELHELFKDVGMKYKAKYRSLMFNIKDRKNHTLWQKICNKSITPRQLVRLSPEELASQELAEWRDQEAKHQLELIKKSELDLLAASKTYVLKTHKGEEVMQTKESVSTELDPNVPVEDVVIALNDSTVGEEVTREVIADSQSKTEEKKESSSRKREKEDNSSSRSKKSRRDSRRDSDRKSRSSRRKSASRDRDSKDDRRRSTRRSEKKSRNRSESRDRSKRDSKEKSNSRERSRQRSRSREKLKRSKSRERSRSVSKQRERSRSRDRTRRRSRSREAAKRHDRSRSKRISSDDKPKHRSKSQDINKNKTDSTDSDSVERPKSAMLKDLHPEYDPHEPMITSAISEEDLRKSEEAYDVTFKSDALESEPDYDPSKTFALESSVILPGATITTKLDKTSEIESDQEPSSTVENAAATIWNGCINMVDVARFYVAAHEVSGSTVDLEEDLSMELDIVGRINPDTVWDYISKTKKASNKDIVILRLQAANDEEKMQYIALYSYLSSRNRLGVVKVPNTTTVKDFYIVPLPANTSLPPILLPLDGPGLGDVKTHLLIAVIIRQRKKRLSAIPKDIITTKVSKVSRKRSYTPPVLGKSTYTPPTSPKRRAMPLPTYPASALSTSVKDKIAASLACADDEEAYSPGSSNGSNSIPAPAVILPPSSNSLRNKMEELNRQIEEQKQQILKMAQADSSVGAEDEAYSPSRPMTPPSVVPPALADISLPSNLQEILATIKQRSENTVSDVDMRTLPP